MSRASPSASGGPLVVPKGTLCQWNVTLDLLPPTAAAQLMQSQLLFFQLKELYQEQEEQASQDGGGRQIQMRSFYSASASDYLELAVWPTDLRVSRPAPHAAAASSAITISLSFVGDTPDPFEVRISDQSFETTPLEVHSRLRRAELAPSEGRNFGVDAASRNCTFLSGA